MTVLLALAVPAAAQRPGDARASVGPAERPPQIAAELRPGDTVWATPAQRYGAGFLQRWVLGSGHRDLWALPVPAQVLDLERFGGGLTPTDVGGGLQTRSLRFRGADGRTWVFRSIDKDASRTLDPVLRETLAAWAVQDRVSAILPLGALVVSPLLEAGGVLHARPTLVVMPDDPALGEHREAFARLLGWIEERPDENAEDEPAFAGAERVVSSERLLERLEEDPANAVDAREYLRARLLDFLVGDWDRHPDQWRWAGFPRDHEILFRPVPRDRDWAFSHLDGLLPRVTAVPWPHYVGFGPDYPSIFRLAWSGRALDRRILPLLDRTAFAEVGEDLAARITDAVIADAVGRLPAAYLERVGEDLEASLRRRRDALPGLAMAFHAHLAGWTDLHGTDGADVARVRRLGRGRVEVTVASAERPDAPWLGRVLDTAQTREVRLYLHGGDDRVVVEGEDEAAPLVRVVGGGGDDVLEDRTEGRGVSLHDDGEDDRLAGGPHAAVDRRAWAEPFDPAGTTHRAPARDWGVRWVPLGRVEVGPDVGVLVGAGVRRTAYGFRRWPYASRFDAWGGIASATGEPVAFATFDAPLGGGLGLVAEAAVRGGLQQRFHGWGNDSPSDDRSGRWETARGDLSFGVSARYRVAGDVWATAGATARALGAEEGPRSLVREVAPYGSGEFEQVTLSGGLRMGSASGDDDRPVRLAASLEARGGPALLDVAEAFGGLRAAVAGAATLDAPLRPRVAVRVIGERVWGDAPWHEAATLGGSSTLRGEPRGRWIGDAVAAAGAEADVRLGDALLVLPAEVGLLALADVGRVWDEGESAGGWHRTAGAGVWVSFVDTYRLRMAVVRGERTRVTLNAGLILDGAP